MDSMVSVPSVYLKKMDTSMSTKVTPPVSIIFRGSDDPGHYVWSPFVTKLEFRLRLAGIPYRIGAGNPWLGPKGKIPYVELAADTGAGPTMLGDSTLITKHLIESSALDDLNGGLTSAEKTRDLAIRALLEDKLYFYHMRECWLDNYYVQRDKALASVPFPMRILIGQSVHRKVKRTLYGQGAGRYTDAEIDAFRTEIWSSLNDMLSGVRAYAQSSTVNQEGNSEVAMGREPFWCLGGEEPTEADVTLLALSQVGWLLRGTSLLI
ncbi:hypothetical protein H2203_002177 [Taxawa tesnikishii (nom. ined.)]|nr:hypothetical protein H2203_002177 [Dothideales sp. JES 119]